MTEEEITAAKELAARASGLLVGGVVDSASVIAEIDSVSGEISTSLDVFFILVSGYLVFLMQAGFAMLTAGSVRSKNTKNVLLKNVLDACVGSIAYFLFGYAFAYGPKGNSFIGWGYFALTEAAGEEVIGYHNFFFQWAFAATAATIVSGSVAERTSFYAYLGYAFVLTAFVYPVVSHWVWGGGWASEKFFGFGMIDFAGCSVVHMGTHRSLSALVYTTVLSHCTANQFFLLSVRSRWFRRPCWRHHSRAPSRPLRLRG